jgi:hypothetical protein
MKPFMSKTQVEISQIEKADLIRYYTMEQGKSDISTWYIHHP